VAYAATQCHQLSGKSRTQTHPNPSLFLKRGAKKSPTLAKEGDLEGVWSFKILKLMTLVRAVARTLGKEGSSPLL